MAQGLYQHVRDTWRRPKDALPHMYRQQRMAQWRREPVNCRIERPTRLDAARRMGYKAKQGVVLIRTRVRRGGLRKGKIHMKRKPSKAGISKITMAKNTRNASLKSVSTATSPTWKCSTPTGLAKMVSTSTTRSS